MNRKERRAAGKRDAGGSSPSLAALFAQAVQHRQAGRLEEADAFCRRILASDPAHAATLHLLGLMMQQVGRHDAAIELIGRAIAASGRNADYHYDLGASL